MLKRVPKMCVTCQHYEPYHCTLDGSHIRYFWPDERNNCKTYSLSEHYRKGEKPDKNQISMFDGDETDDD